MEIKGYDKSLNPSNIFMRILLAFEDKLDKNELIDELKNKK